MAPVVLVWLVTLGACSAARRAPVLEAEMLEAEQESLAADAAEVRPSVENAPEQQPTAPSLPPLEPMLVTQLDEQPRVSDLDAARLSLLMSQPIPIRELLLLLVRDTRISIVPDPNVEGSFVGELKDVTVRQALELSLTPLGLDYAVEGGVVRVLERRRNTRIFPLDDVATRRTVRRTLVDGSADEQASSTVATAVDQTDICSPPCRAALRRCCRLTDALRSTARPRWSRSSTTPTTSRASNAISTEYASGRIVRCTSRPI